MFFIRMRDQSFIAKARYLLCLSIPEFCRFRYSTRVIKTKAKVIRAVSQRVMCNWVAKGT